MNKFVYKDELGVEEPYEVCYPIETSMSLKDLIDYLTLKAQEFKEQNPAEDIFYPFGGSYYQMSAATFLHELGLGFKAYLIPIEEWSGIKI